MSSRDEPISAWMRAPEPQQGPALPPEWRAREFAEWLAERDAYHDEVGKRIRERLGYKRTL